MTYMGGYSGNRGGAYMGRISSPMATYNPMRPSIVYSHNSGATYIGSATYHASSAMIPIEDKMDMMFDIRHAQTLELYAPFDNYLNPAQAAYEPPRISSPKIIFSPTDFLKRNRPKMRWIGHFEEIEEWVGEIYKKTTGRSFPAIEINIVSKEELDEEYGKSGKKADPSLQGFYDGRIFIKEGRLDNMLLTLGHELGHAWTAPLSNPELEEAKAYAFTEAWVKAIAENDIAGLSESIEITRQNGTIPAWAQVHLNGYRTFQERLRNGLAPLEIIDNLIAMDHFI